MVATALSQVVESDQSVRSEVTYWRFNVRTGWRELTGGQAPRDLPLKAVGLLIDGKIVDAANLAANPPGKSEQGPPVRVADES